MGGLYITMNDYPLLMNTKSFVMMLHQYIYDEYTLDIMKKCFEEFFTQDKYTVNVFLDQRRISITTKISVKEPVNITVYTQDILATMFNFFRHPDIYSKIIESVISINGTNTRTNKSPMLEILDNIMNHHQQTLSLLFEMHIVGDTILINL